MTARINTGDPRLDEAIRKDLGVEPSTSITLRDLFAAFAMAGMLANPSGVRMKYRLLKAWVLADAMLAERDRFDQRERMPAKEVGTLR
jgi:hypothetical protein